MNFNSKIPAKKDISFVYNKLGKFKPSLLVILCLFLLLFSFKTIAQGSQEDSIKSESLLNIDIKIKNISQGWVITKYSGEEKDLYNVEISDRKSKNPEICLISKDNSKTSSKTKIAIYDKDGTKKEDINKINKNGKDRFCKDITTEKYVKYGEQSIVLEYQDLKTVSYEGAWFNISSTLYKNISGNWDNTINTIFVRSINSDNFKFGANDTGTVSGEINLYKYSINSSETIKKLSDNIYYISKETPKKCLVFDCIETESHNFDFTDICTQEINQTDGNILFDPNCTFNLTNLSNLEVIFKAKHNDSLGYTSIDPTITITDVSTYTSTKLNITAENKFTHLTIGDSSIGFINDSNTVLYLTMDNNISSTVYDYSSSNNDFTITNPIIPNVNGIYGTAMNFSGGYMARTSFTNLPSNQMTISVWVKVVQDKNWNRILNHEWAANEGAWILLSQTTSTMGFSIKNASTTFTATKSYTLGTWNHVVAVYNGTIIQVYVNGVKGTDSASFVPFSLDTAGAVDIGGQINPSNRLNGTLDEVLILNTALNSSQITSLYNNKTSKFFPRGEQIFNNVDVSSLGVENLMNVTINSTMYQYSMINVSVGNSSGGSYTYGNEYAFTNNFISNIPITTPNNISLKFIFYAGNSSDSFYSPTLENDIVLNSYYNGTDIFPPQLTIDSPLSGAYYSNANVNLNVSATETISTWWYSLNGGTNTTFTPNITITGNEGSNNIIVYANDTLNNINSTSRTFNIDTIFPIINITFPLNNTNQSTNNFAVNFTVTEANINNCWYSRNGGTTNNSLADCVSNITGVTWNEGVNNVTVYANDSASNINSSSVRFIVDTQNPQINLTVPLNTSYNAIQTALNFTVSDTTLQSCWYSLNLGVTNVSTSCILNITGLNSGQGSSTWKVYSNDSFGRENSSSVTFFVDSILPTINFTSPTPLNNTITNNPNLTINFTGTDTNFQAGRILFNGTNYSATCTGSSPYYCNYTFSNIQDGIYNYTAYANDTLNNVNSTEMRFITIDTTVPTGNYQTPTENSGVHKNRNYIEINVTGSDTYLNSILVRLYNSTHSQINSSLTTSSPNYINFSNMAEGLYFYNVTINDTVNNILELATRNITLDRTYPLVSIAQPQNITYATTSLSLNFTVTEANLQSCWYTNDSGTNNYTLTNCANTTYSTSQGSTIIKVYANDTAGNENSTSVTFFVDSILPTINFTSPTESSGVTLSRNYIFVNVTVTELNPANITFFLFNSTTQLNVTTLTMSSQTANNSFNFSSLSSGLYFYNVTIRDITNNANSTETRNITLDTTPPSINYISPLNTSTNTAGVITFSANTTETVTWMYIYTGQSSNISAGTATSFSDSKTLSAGTYNITVYANDSLGNLATHLEQNVVISATGTRTVYPTVSVGNEYKQGDTVVLTASTDDANGDPISTENITVKIKYPNQTYWETGLPLTLVTSGFYRGEKNLSAINPLGVYSVEFIGSSFLATDSFKVVEEVIEVETLGSNGNAVIVNQNTPSTGLLTNKIYIALIFAVIVIIFMTFLSTGLIMDTLRKRKKQQKQE